MLPVVLVVDDDERNRRLLSAMLSPRHVLLEAESGERALELAEREAVDLVLLDVMMPGIGGLETCRRLKDRPPGARFLPVVLVTALNAQADRNAGLAAGADEFVSKPIDRTELGLRVAGLLRQRDQERRIARQVEELQHLQALKDDLFGFLVHDLKNALVGVDGYLELLQEQALPPGPAGYATQALDASRRLGALVEELLEVRQLEESRLPLRREAGEVEPLLREAARSVEGAALRRGVEVKVAAPSLPRVAVDRRLVQRSVENLLGNAVRFSPRGETVLVSAWTEPGRVVVSIADRGPGVAESTKARLFEKYRTDDSRAASPQRGFGLGLHFVKLVAGAHGGEAFVRDREGGGSEFGLSLPEAPA